MNNENMDKLYPKCENAQRLYVTSGSQVRPCCWLGEAGPINRHPNWNLNNNSIENILNNELKKYVENLKKEPKTWAQNACWKQCSKPFTSTNKPTENWVYVNE